MIQKTTVNPSFSARLISSANAVTGNLAECAGLFLSMPNRFARALGESLMEGTVTPRLAPSTLPRIRTQRR